MDSVDTSPKSPLSSFSMPLSESPTLPAEIKEKPHFSKLHFDPKLSQSKRRKLTLEWQKRRRDHILDKIRQLEGDSGMSDSETDDGFDFLENVNNSKLTKEEGSDNAELKVVKNKKRKNQKNKRRRSAPATVMLSEWFIQKPEDFEDQWVGVLCPAGKRCIIVACRGRTKVYSRTDDFMGSYLSSLPGGRKVAGTRGRGVTILDCVWSESAHVFYVLDLICWNSHSCINCDMEYRQFFLASKISENQDLMVASPFNQIPLMPLPYFATENLPTILTSTYPPFPDLIDGILLVHKEAFYISEVNPLCLWLRLSDVTKRLAMEVNPDLLAKEAPTRERKTWKDKEIMDLDCDTSASTSVVETEGST